MNLDDVSHTSSTTREKLHLVDVLKKTTSFHVHKFASEVESAKALRHLIGENITAITFPIHFQNTHTDTHTQTHTHTHTQTHTHTRTHARTHA